MSISINILLATVGRPTLQRMLNSLCDQLDVNDYLTIVFDGHSSIPKFDTSKFKCKVKQYYEPIALKYWGHGIRNKYANLLDKTDFVMHGDDDDIYLPNSIQHIKNNCKNKNTLYIYKLQNGNNITTKIPVIRIGNIGTPSGIIPFELNKKSKWGYFYGGDGAFYENLVPITEKIVFMDYIIYKIRPGELYRQKNINLSKLIKLKLIGK